MNIILKESKTGWVKVSDEISILVDYPKIEQQRILNHLVYEIVYVPKTDNEIENIENKPDVLSINEKYHQLLLKFTIKDWKGVKNSDGEDVPFKLVNNEMENELWESLCRSLTLLKLYQLVDLIRKEIEFTEADKKK